MLTELPDRHWQYLHADYKGPIGQRYYLHMFIDQYTKYSVVKVCTSTDWEQMEPMIEKVLATFRNIEKLTTDRGPPYNSQKFRKFAEKIGFKHHICTPDNLAANGFMEVFQKVLVKMVQTAIIEERDLTKVVQEYLTAYKAYNANKAATAGGEETLGHG